MLTINGIFTDEHGAQNNADALRWKLDKNFNNQPLTIDFLHNETHLGGIGDIFKAAYQKIFENETVEDYDLVEMIKTASEKVKTQKVLLVAHSQGNFYANSFYDTVAGKEGGVPRESIGVYAVATPSSRVAGGGKWLTSDTDKIIAKIVGNIPFKKIMPPNTHIVLNESDDSSSHSFSGAYLKYRGSEIVSDIRSSLDKLTENPNKDIQKPCIDPPKLTLAHKVAGAFFIVVDPVASDAINSVVFAGKETYNAGVAVVKTALQTAVAIGGLVKLPLSLFDSKENNLADNPASVISVFDIAKNNLATNNENQTVVVENKIIKSDDGDNNNSNQEKLVLAQKSLDDISKQIIVLEKNREIKGNATKSLSATDTSLVATAENKKQNTPESRGSPRLLFVGTLYPGFGGGGDIAIAQTVAVEQNNEETITLSSPTISVAQCAQSLASDGCLLATTTVNFSWTAVSGATHYTISKNGEYATTTDLSFIANITDFSDYIFSISAISNATTSATTTAQTVSVATIPIAINEIAWMGTTASAYDEWMELKNNTKYRIDLSQWALESTDGAPFIALAGEMAPYEYRILERRANTITASSIISVYGNGLSQWALGNNGEEIILSHSSTTLDRTPIISGDSWTAGENTSSTTRKTMERISPKQSGDNPANWATWGTNVNFIKNGRDTNNIAIFGTPGECNSASYESINNGQNATSSLTLSANNCYYSASGVSVSASSTLTIEEGVRISLYQNNLVVNGIIIASGTPDNPIIIDSFSGSPTDNRVKISGTNGTSTMENISISNTNGIYLNNGASLEITNAEFANNDYGIDLYNGSSANIENVNFASTTRESISAYSGSSITVSSSTITNTIDSDAVGVYHSTLSMSSTTINSTYDGDGIGVYYSTISIASSTISNIYEGDGISVYNSTVSIASSTINNMLDGAGFDAYCSIVNITSSTISNIYDGDGIGIYDSTASVASSTITNIYDGEGIGVYDSVVSIASSTISNVLDGDGIGLDNSTTTMQNVSVDNVSDDGVSVYGGSVSGNAIIDGVGVEW